MSRIERFEIICPKAERVVCRSVINLDALVQGKTIMLCCPESRTPENTKPLASENFGPIFLGVSIVNSRDQITIKGQLNPNNNQMGATLDCGHCGAHVDFMWDYM